MLNYHLSLMRAFGAVGSAPHWQCGGQGFESPKVHQNEKETTLAVVSFFVLTEDVGDSNP